MMLCVLPSDEMDDTVAMGMKSDVFGHNLGRSGVRTHVLFHNKKSNTKSKFR